MDDGRVIGVGLLPSHTEGSYLLRLYDGDHYLAVYRVERTALLDALEALGVPVDDPAFFRNLCVLLLRLRFDWGHSSSSHCWTSLGICS